MPWETNIAQDAWGNAWAIVMMALFVGVAALLIVGFVRTLIIKPAEFVSHEPEPDPALLALDERYAAGEIDEASYLAQRRELGR